MSVLPVWAEIPSQQSILSKEELQPLVLSPQNLVLLSFAVSARVQGYELFARKTTTCVNLEKKSKDKSLRYDNDLYWWLTTLSRH
jgi:hypothetical protein